MRRALWKLPSILLLSTLFLAACGGGSTEPSGSPTTPDQTDEATDPAETETDTTDEEWQSIVEAAQDEGRVVLYGAPVPAIMERMSTAFTEAYPEIELEYLRGASGELISKIDQELATGVDGADVVVITELGWFSQLAEDGNLVEPQGSNADAWPTEYARDGGLTRVLTMEAAVIPYNTDLVSTPPTDYVDLLDAEYAGKIVTTDVVSTFLTAWYGWLEETRGDDFLPGLAAQDPSLVVGTPPAVQAVAAGEYAVSAWSNISGAKAVMDEGAPLDFVLPNPAIGIPFPGGVLTNAKRPNAAIVFFDWLMGPEGQQALTGDGWGASPIGVEGSLDISVIEPWDPAEWPEEAVNDFNARWQEIFR